MLFCDHKINKKKYILNNFHHSEWSCSKTKNTNCNESTFYKASLKDYILCKDKQLYFSTTTHLNLQ